MPARDLGMPSGDRVWREQKLRSAVLAGDELAWQTWYDESFAGLFAYVVWRCAGMYNPAEDIVQETWLTAVRRIRAFDPGRGSFSNWLRGIAANILRNHFRTNQNHKVHSLQGELAAPESLDQQETAERIARSLADLPEHYEAVLRAKYLEQLSVDKIACDWNQTPKAIESLLSRARDAFHAAYGKRE